MSLHDLIAEDVAVWHLDAEGFAEPVTIYPQGDRTIPHETVAIWDEDALPGTNETQGDGRMANRRTGRSDRKSIVILLPIKSPIQDTQSELHPDEILRHATKQIVKAKKIIGRDEALMDLLCIEHDAVSRRRGTRKG